MAGMQDEYRRHNPHTDYTRDGWVRPESDHVCACPCVCFCDDVERLADRRCLTPCEALAKARAAE
jgi:hypothetical protein